MINTALRNKRCDDTAALLAAGTLTIYSGTPPANANTALSGNTALAQHTIAGFQAAVAGVATADAIADDTIDNSGTATFARIVAGSYTVQLSVGTSGAEVIVNSTTFVATGTSTVNSLTLTEPAG